MDGPWVWHSSDNSFGSFRHGSYSRSFLEIQPSVDNDSSRLTPRSPQLMAPANSPSSFLEESTHIYMNLLERSDFKTTKSTKSWCCSGVTEASFLDCLNTTDDIVSSDSDIDCDRSSLFHGSRRCHISLEELSEITDLELSVLLSTDSDDSSLEGTFFTRFPVDGEKQPQSWCSRNSRNNSNSSNSRHGNSLGSSTDNGYNSSGSRSAFLESEQLVKSVNSQVGTWLQGLSSSYQSFALSDEEQKKRKPTESRTLSKSSASSSENNFPLEDSPADSILDDHIIDTPRVTESQHHERSVNSDATSFMHHHLADRGVAVDKFSSQRRRFLSKRLKRIGKALRNIGNSKVTLKTLAVV